MCQRSIADMDMEKRVNTIVSHLYEASIDPTAWTHALDLLADSFNAVGASYFVWDNNQQRVNLWCAVGHDEVVQQRYLVHYAGIDPTRNAVMDSRPGELFYSHQMFSRSYIGSSEYFQDYLMPAGIGEVVGGKTMENCGFTGFFSLQQTREVTGFSPREHELLDRIAQHFARASNIHARITQLQRKTLTLQTALQTVNLPVLVVDAMRHIHFVNGAAEILLGRSYGLVVKSDRLFSVNANVNHRLGEVIRRATSPLGRESGGIELTDKGKRRFLTVVPIPEAQSDGIGGGRLALIVGSPWLLAGEDFTRLIADLYMLTPAERKLACKLVAGASLNEAADQLNLGRETVRSQLRSLFEKTGTNRQAQLVSLLQELAFISPLQNSVDT